MSELWTTAREAVAALAEADRGRRRFGAAQHRYDLAPALDRAAITAIEATIAATIEATIEARLAGIGATTVPRIAALPDEVAAFATEFSAGGAGPGYGIAPIARAAEFVVAAPKGVPWRAALPLAHLGCGYAAVVALDGVARGEIWIDARAIGVVKPIAAGITAFYLEWIDRLAHGRWPEAHVPAGTCALAAALSGYLARCEADHGLESGALAGEALREALGRLGPGAIEIAAESAIAWFDEGDRVDPCIACARLIENLAGDGLRSDVVRPGVPPKPQRG